MRTPSRLAKTAAVLAIATGLAGAGVFSAYVAETSNADNNITAGSVRVTDNDASAALFPSGTFGNVKPSDAAAVRCLKVDWAGSLTSTAKLYASTVPTNGVNIAMKVERGTSTDAAPTFPNCPSGTGTTWDTTSPLFNGNLDTVASTFAGGYPLKSGANTLTGGTAETVYLRFTMTVNDDTTVNAHTSTQSTGAHNWVLEARSN